MKIDSQEALKSGKRSCNYSVNPKRIYQSRDRYQAKKGHGISECISMNGSVYNRSINNYTLDYTSSNSTPSERTFAIKHIASTSDTFTVTGPRMEQKLTNEKVCSNIFTKKPQGIFCKDPNKRLKNLFTIIKPNEKFNESTYLPKCNDVDLLSKTKELLVKLIDKELLRIRTADDNANKNVHQNLENVIDNNVLKFLKLECMKRIEDELRLLKRLAKY